MTNPRRRTTIVSEAVGDGLGVLDAQLQKSYVLNATAALVFQHCDGQTTPQQLTERLRQKFNISRNQAEQLLWLALEDLEKANLLQEKITTTQAPRPMITRRQALTAFTAAGLSLALMPMMSSVVLAQNPPTTTPPPMQLQPTTHLTQQAGYTQSCTANIPAATPYVRTCTIAFTLKNTSGGPLRVRHYQVKTVSSHVFVLNGTPNPGQVGTVVTGAGSVANDATFQPSFTLGLASNTAYTIRFNVYGYEGSVVAAGAEAIDLGVFEATVSPDGTMSNGFQLFLPVIQQ